MHSPDPGCMGLVAAEVNHVEAAFAHPLPTGAEADWALRWFTPVTEVALCGHATLAVAYVLRTTGVSTGTVRFAAPRPRADVLPRRDTCVARRWNYPLATAIDSTTPGRLLSG
ncbi:hypothetical protein GCM10020369_84720 [Cryptosporangium minutisporangium]|uniref:PhzF family phenazine biosynthesis protein n=1 Tax=Cryptosporangium minutisporangium TaxID=113569 RepID=A0ABP6TEA9_9ACTN